MSPLLADLRRCARAAFAPVVVTSALTATSWLVTRVTPPEQVPVVAPLYRAFLGATVCSAAWVLLATVVTATQPRRDGRAAERLATLHECAKAPGRVLVWVQRITWSSPAGQHVVAVDVTEGIASEVWLSEVLLPAGSFAILDRMAYPVRVVDQIDRRAVVAAHRHAIRVAARRAAAARRASALRARADRQAAADLVREAERLLRHR